MDVSIIIVNYHTSVLIKNLLDTIYNKTEGVSFEIIVVDNHPTPQFATDLGIYMNAITYLPLAENVGFGRANNEGVKVAKGRNIFFLNPDTLIVNNAVKILSDYLDAHEKVGACGGNLYDASMMPMHSFMRTLSSLLWEVDSIMAGLIFKVLYGKNTQHNYTQHPIKVGYVTGADMMVKRAILDKVGLFDPDFFMYYEETELSYRIKKAGYKIMSVPAAKIIHLEGQSFSMKEERIRTIISSQKLYDKKTNHSRFYSCINTRLRVLNCRFRILIFSMIKDENRLLFWRAWLKGYLEQTNRFSVNA